MVCLVDLVGLFFESDKQPSGSKKGQHGNNNRGSLQRSCNERIALTMSGPWLWEVWKTLQTKKNLKSNLTIFRNNLLPNLPFFLEILTPVSQWHSHPHTKKQLGVKRCRIRAMWSILRPNLGGQHLQKWMMPGIVFFKKTRDLFFIYGFDTRGKSDCRLSVTLWPWTLE